ncbi:MAG: hypothetical protein ACYCT1_08090 [Steroidobacteraceae bacterium]
MMLFLRPGSDWPSAVDTMTAGQAVEAAIHATNPTDFAADMAVAVAQVTRAAAYWGQQGDARQSAYAASVVEQLQAYAADVAGGGDLATTQGRLYTWSEAAMQRLYRQAEPVRRMSGWAILGWSAAGSVLGGLAIVAAVEAYDRRKQRGRAR